mgnify:CR=1 FL=1
MTRMPFLRKWENLKQQKELKVYQRQTWLEKYSKINRCIITEI